MKTLAGLMMVLSSAACGASGDAAISAEAPLMETFNYDSGSLPAESPVQLQLIGTATGRMTLEADEPGVGMGVVTLDAQFDLAPMVHSTLAGAVYDGPLLGLPSIAIPFTADTSFDPMMVGARAHLEASVEARPLMTMALADAIGVPGVAGELILDLRGGDVIADFTGTCADAGRFSGRLTVGGELTLGGRVRVELPVVGMRTYELPAMQLQVPTLDRAMAFATPDDPAAIGCE